jgi:ketosteroid isomerase-like protein
MRRHLTLVVVGIICAAFVACQPGAAGLSDQDKAAIRQLDENWIKVMLSEKPDLDTAIPAYYAEDAQFMMERMPTVDGREALKAFMSRHPPIKDFKLTEVSLEGGGDIAYRHYTYVLTMSVPGAPEPMIDNGKGIEVFKKQADGSWRVIRDIGNSDLPMPGLTVPTGAVAADASDELKKLGDVMGNWKFDGTWKTDAQAAGGPVDLVFHCGWFPGGRQLVYQFSGTMAGMPFEELGAYIYDPKVKAYAFYGIANDGTSAPGVVTIKPGLWLHAYDVQVGGKPAKAHFTLSDMSPAGGAWKYEVSVGGGPWTVMGEGKYVKAN